MIPHGRITLRHATEADLPFLLRAMTDSRARGPHILSRIPSPHDVRKRFAENGYSSEEHEVLLVADESGRVIGNVLHFRTRPYSTAREIGWILYDEKDRGRGYASEAATALVDYLFRSFPAVHRLECTMQEENHASVRVAEKAGFVREGRLRGLVFLDGRFADSLLMALLRPDWERRRAATAGT